MPGSNMNQKAPEVSYKIWSRSPSLWWERRMKRWENRKWQQRKKLESPCLLFFPILLKNPQFTFISDMRGYHWEAYSQPGRLIGKNKEVKIHQNVTSGEQTTLNLFLLLFCFSKCPHWIRIHRKTYLKLTLQWDGGQSTYVSAWKVMKAFIKWSDCTDNSNRRAQVAREQGKPSPWRESRALCPMCDMSWNGKHLQWLVYSVPNSRDIFQLFNTCRLFRHRGQNSFFEIFTHLTGARYQRILTGLYLMTSEMEYIYFST